MSETTNPGTGDPSSQPDYEQLGDAGNPFTGDSSETEETGSAGIDNAPGEHGYVDDPEQNAALPDWGPTDGKHGVDGADPDA